jgi:hypothetical protein
MLRFFSNILGSRFSMSATCYCSLHKKRRDLMKENLMKPPPKVVCAFSTNAKKRRFSCNTSYSASEEEFHCIGTGYRYLHNKTVITKSTSIHVPSLPFPCSFLTTVALAFRPLDIIFFMKKAV